jgi:1,4-dihydroxy-2-naphthoate octaprenyltransferase
MKHSFKEWMIAVRPWSFPASAMPVLVTLAFLHYAGYEMNWWYGVWALLNIVVFHAAGNTWSDYFDYKKGVDREDTFGAKTLTDGMFTPKEIYRLSLGLLTVALLGGIGLMLCTGLPLLYVGIGGMLCTLLYPMLKFNALGDADIFCAYAILPMLGTSFVATGAFHYEVLWNAIPVGLITVGILHANNTRDMQHDKRANIKTFAMLMGNKASAYAYCFEMVFPFVWVIGCIVAGVLPYYSLLVLVALMPALKNASMAIKFLKEGMTAIANLDEMTAKLQLIFSLLLTISLFVAYFIG